MGEGGQLTEKGKEKSGTGKKKKMEYSFSSRKKKGTGYLRENQRGSRGRGRRTKRFEKREGTHLTKGREKNVHVLRKFTKSCKGGKNLSLTGSSGS